MAFLSLLAIDLSESVLAFGVSRDDLLDDLFSKFVVGAKTRDILSDGFWSWNEGSEALHKLHGSEFDAKARVPSLQGF
ncbi:MAG: hypothetical protein IPK04_20195 [Bdellovibrionales bacterium]|nr:hypothetical protein [Bdellovibrionales bacterium]